LDGAITGPAATGPHPFGIAAQRRMRPRQKIVFREE
jgi:hypothetical protein